MLAAIIHGGVSASDVVLTLGLAVGGFLAWRGQSGRLYAGMVQERDAKLHDMADLLRIKDAELSAASLKIAELQARPDIANLFDLMKRHDERMMQFEKDSQEQQKRIVSALDELARHIQGMRARV